MGVVIECKRFMTDDRLVPNFVCIKMLLLLCLVSPIICESFNNDWVAELKGGEEKAQVVAKDTGCELIGEVLPESNIFQFRCHHVRRRSTSQDQAAHQTMEDHEAVEWTEQQEVKRRRKRPVVDEEYWRMERQPDTYQDLNNINDPRFPQMWYLNRGHMKDMNVQGAWLEGYSGKGIVVTILDD